MDRYDCMILTGRAEDAAAEAALAVAAASELADSPGRDRSEVAEAFQDAAVTLQGAADRFGKAAAAWREEGGEDA